MMEGMNTRRRRMSWAPQPRPAPEPDQLESLAAFVLREMPSERDLVDSYSAARARAKADWQNYAAWINGEREPHPTLPAGPEEKTIAGLELALRIIAIRLCTHQDYREEWRP